MTDTTMIEDLDLPGGGDPRNVEVQIFMADPLTGEPLEVVYNDDADQALTRTLIGVGILTVGNGGIDPAGRWTRDLPPTSQLRPAGALYAVKVLGHTVSEATRFFTVPDSSGPHTVSDNLVVPPALV